MPSTSVYEKIRELAKIGCEVIDVQLLLASKKPDEALQDLWVLGYCFGIFDAMGQRNELDQYTEGFPLITIGFLQLMSSDLEEADQVRRGLDNQSDPRFAEGIRTGGSDLYAWFADTNKAPMTLCNYLNSGRRS